MYDKDSNIMGKSGVTVEQLDSAMRDIRPDHRLKPALSAIIQAEKTYNISALFMAAHAATESGWGNSMIAKTKNNLFGFNAIDSNPGKASRYASQEESVKYYAAFLSEHYLTEGGKYFNGFTPSGVMTRYASAGDRAANTIANIMNMLADRIGITKEPQPSGFPDKTPKEPEKTEPTTEQKSDANEGEKEDARPDAEGDTTPTAQKKRDSTSKK